MTLQKTGDNQPAEVFRGKEAEVVNRHMQRTGKAVSDFGPDELQRLNIELESVREPKESSSAQDQEPQESVTDKDETSSAKSGSTKKVKPLN